MYNKGRKMIVWKRRKREKSLDLNHFEIMYMQ